MRWMKGAAALLTAGLLAGCGFAAGNISGETRPGAGDAEAGSRASAGEWPEAQQDPGSADQPVSQPISAAENQPGAQADSEGAAQPSYGAENDSQQDGSAYAERLLRTMTLRQKVCQLFIVRPEALRPAGTGDQQAQSQGNGSDSTETTEWTDGMADTLKEYPVGGVILFKPNIVSPEQVRTFTRAMQDAGEIPLFISVDEEGGSVARLANHPAFNLPKYDSAAAVGASGNAADGRAMGQVIGSYLKEYGFNMDFAPDADVNTNPDNPVIGKRAFSSDGETAARMAAAMADGLRQEGIIPVFKHFPGHGDTAEDSHYGIAVTNKTEEEMSACEWLPFQAAGDGDGVMIGHIAAPAVTGDMTPATLSERMVTGVLRQQLGFPGLIITDAMEMGAITETYSGEEAAVLAVKAGCDILLLPADLRSACDALVRAVETGELSEERLDDSVRRILQYKFKYLR